MTRIHFQMCTKIIYWHKLKQGGKAQITDFLCIFLYLGVERTDRKGAGEEALF